MMPQLSIQNVIKGLFVFVLLKDFYSVSATFEVVPLGDHYEDHYTAGAWNYDYSQNADSCGTCSTSAKCGPDCWYNVVPSSSAVVNKCGGKSQTPINIVQVETNSEIDYPKFVASAGGCKSWAQFADDHAFEVSFVDAECENLKLIYNKETYTLLQFHFHSPAEHAVGGGIADAELHMVHKSESGSLLVLGIRMSASLAYNTFLGQFWEAADIGATGQNYESGTQYSKEYEVTSTVAVNPYKDFLPASRDFYTYSGSLTTYPCTEGVTWIVFEEIIQIGEIDLLNMKMAIAKEPHTITLSSAITYLNFADNRPIQQLNNRVVHKYSAPNVISTPSKPNAKPVAKPSAKSHHTSTSTAHFDSKSQGIFNKFKKLAREAERIF